MITEQQIRQIIGNAFTEEDNIFPDGRIIFIDIDEYKYEEIRERIIKQIMEAIYK